VYRADIRRTVRSPDRRRLPRHSERRHPMLNARVLVFALLISIGQVRAHDDGDRKWVASWATSPATFFNYVAPAQPFVLMPGSPIQYVAANIQPDLAFPFPNATASGAAAAAAPSLRESFGATPIRAKRK